MKRVIVFATILFVAFPLSILAATTVVTYTTKTGDTIHGQLVVAGQHIKVYQTAPVPPPVTPPVTTPVTGEIRFTAYTTGYAALDNTPRGSTQIDLGGHSGNAGGTGTYADPITLAVGHSIINGQDIGDYAYGTKFYVPNLRKYFTAADSCGDGNTPQNGPCHTGYQGHVWLDLYVGASLQSAVLSCEDSITDLHLVIENPASNYSVVPGAVYDTGCKQYGETVVTQ